MSNTLKIDLFKKLTAMDTKFYDVNSSGLVLSRFLSDPDQATKRLIETLKTFILSIFELVALVFVLLANSWKLAIIGVGVMAIAITPVTFIRKKIKAVSNAGMVVGGNMTTNFNETFAGNKIVTAYNLQENQNNKFDGEKRTIHPVKHHVSHGYFSLKRFAFSFSVDYFRKPLNAVVVIVTVTALYHFFCFISRGCSGISFPTDITTKGCTYSTDGNIHGFIFDDASVLKP